ncbi:hypothetical protein OPV22_018971 [Ensete ventricosum]|uniref:MADS-box domain-containing protein n=1 Tax=Ensete ventricosum TaxID=4639 RepID=A0AAV8PJQ6_ENSVE|nr:hypothetical protein OPV22_018971 [Ensete ventricosum]
MERKRYGPLSLISTLCAVDVAVVSFSPGDGPSGLDPDRLTCPQDRGEVVHVLRRLPNHGQGATPGIKKPKIKSAEEDAVDGRVMTMGPFGRLSGPWNLRSRPWES